MIDKSIAVLGSTGSVGRQALEVARFHNIRVTALSAYSNTALLEEQIRQFRPKKCAVADHEAAVRLKTAVADTDCKISEGFEGVEDTAYSCGADIVLNAVSGIAGLRPTLAAIRAKKDVALANKETLVTAGPIVAELASANGVKIIPVDSEHSAIYQCLNGQKPGRLILTCSGGPFYGMKRTELENVTVNDALAHPTWNMGPKITVDSATLMNKGFEVIEAARLFGVGADDIDVVVHRESVVHSMVEYPDNSVIAQMSVPDMRLCVQYAIFGPERLRGLTGRLDFTKIAKMTFFKPDTETFSLLKLAYKALRSGGIIPAVLNGANERAVELFIKGRISFTDIFDLVEETVVSFANENLKYANTKNVNNNGDESINGNAPVITIETIEVSDRLAREKVDCLAKCGM